MTEQERKRKAEEEKKRQQRQESSGLLETLSDIFSSGNDDCPDTDGGCDSGGDGD